MAKKNKLKPINPSGSMENGPGSSMMTEQQEKMFYSNKRHAAQESSHQDKLRKKVKNNDDNDNDSEDGNIGPIEFSSLNQTSAEEITEFINKLIAKNKVSSKNAFDIPLIHLEQMEDFRASLNENTWKRLSSTLQNDYKIYGYRVDAAHTITYKMVQSIARHEATVEQTFGHNRENLTRVSMSKKSTNMNDLLTSFIDTSFSQNVSKNKMNVDYTKYIEKNQKVLNVSHIESFFGYNPGLERTKRKFDQQGLKALLLNNISLRDGCQLKLDEHKSNFQTDPRQKPKKQAQQRVIQDENHSESQQWLEYLFTSIQARNQSSIIRQDEEIKRNIFTQIYDLNVNQGQVDRDDFQSYDRLYRIVSGEQKKGKRKIENLVEESKEVEKKENHQLDEQVDQYQLSLYPELVENAVPVSETLGASLLDKQNPLQEETCLKVNLNEQNQQNYQNQTNNLLEKGPSDPSSNPQSQSDPKTDKENPLSNQQVKLKNSKQQLQKDQQIQHVLRDKNFQMKEVNIENQEQCSQSNSQSKPQQNQKDSGKYKNIEDYIKIKEIRQSKRQKKPKLNLDELTSDQIAKKLFNRKTTQKKNQHFKDRTQLKLQEGAKKKVNFNKLNQKQKNQRNGLKRSIVLKKSIPEERVYNHIKEKIKQKLSQRRKSQILQEEAEHQKRKKGKRVSKVFDLPVYQFQQSDVNFIKPFEQINPQTGELQVSELSKRHFPSFVFQANSIIEQIKQKKQQKIKQIEAKNKELEEKARQIQSKQAQSNPILEEKTAEFNNLNFNQELVNDELNHYPENLQEGNSQNNSPDISFIQNGMDQTKGNQVVIREAKQKVRRIMLSLFQDEKKKRLNSKRKNQTKKANKISFKKIYQAYYHQQGFISPALCFLTILHLANQHNLMLEGKEDGTDFKIFVDEETQIEDELNIDENRQTQVKILHDSYLKDINLSKTNIMKMELQTSENKQSFQYSSKNQSSLQIQEQSEC